MDGRTVVHLYDDHYAVWDVAYAWHIAGRPPINDSYRTYDDQLRARLAYEAGKGSPADDPRYPDQYQLGHTRAAALDINYSLDRDRKLYRAGLIRPFDWEDWHYAPKDIFYYPVVRSIPVGTKSIDYYLKAADNVSETELPKAIPPTPWELEEKENEMLSLIFANDPAATPRMRWALTGPGYWRIITTQDAANSASVRFGAQQPVTWNDWDEAYNAAIASGFQPVAGQTSRSVIGTPPKA